MNNVLPKVEALADGKKSKVPFVAVVREVAPTKSVKEDAGAKGLGVGEYQHRYFGGRPVYWDEDQKFVEAMGNRRISLKFKAPWWKPWALWKEITEGLKKLKDKGVEGNLVGDGLIQGGVLVVGPGDQGVTFAHFEENDPDVGMPADDIVAGVERFTF
uniref:Peroxiredoxin-like 2A n=1 Tax=Zooxanthella nutricula TaxID=1333877 RepID=A0A6V0KCY1_9DINO|mmetsp:Transcript_103760/g.317736  ORF Transcript_103760/g.317736 Transcript_103760/m.317736 type:complete len:158 (+) Transcript_103760:193-666(+)